MSHSAAISPFLAHDPEFAAVTGSAPRLVRVVETDAHEGPVYVADEDALYFTSLPLDGPVVDIKRVALDDGRVTVVRADANAANGMALDLDGRLVVCEQGTLSEHARISRVDRASGEAETVLDAWGGLPLNSPNDVVVRNDGTIWFTDPAYGHLQGFRPEPQLGDVVYRHDPRTGRTSVVADSFDKPNGLCFSPDESVLYVTDSGAKHHILAYDVRDGRHLVGERLFAVITPGFPDGIKVDADGRVYASSFSGVQVFTPAGDLIGEIHLPGAVNFTFGGADRRVLFITADDAIWAAALAVAGPHRLKGA
jgi:gluconolactonase